MQQDLDKSIKYDVFICHSSKDNSVIKSLIKDLKKQNITYWVDAEQIDFGDHITQKIEDGLQKSRYVIPCLSKNVKTSGWTKAEYGAILHAEFKGKSERIVIPLILENCEDNDIPILLSDKKKVTYSNKTEFNEFINFLKENRHNGTFINSLTLSKEVSDRKKKQNDPLKKKLRILSLLTITVLILAITLSMASDVTDNFISNRTVLQQPTLPVAKLSVTPTSGNAPLTVTFTDQSTGSPLYKWWGFGDGSGSGSSVNNMTHVYDKAGKYKVYLKVANAVGNNTSEYKYITVNKSIYTFDPDNGNDGKSPWGMTLSSLPSYNKTYHLPVKEGYIKVATQYDFIDNSVSPNNKDITDGDGYYISTLSPDKGHWSWNGSYTPEEKDSEKELIPGSLDNVSIDENGTKHLPSGKGTKVCIYSPYSRMTVIAVVGNNGPSPWTGCQFEASNKVFKALGLPDSYNGFSKENPIPEHGSNESDPARYPVIKYADNPYWVEVTWANQSLPAGVLTLSNKTR